MSKYPFTAIVRQEAMKTALILHAIDPSIGGVLIRGHKGTAKSTAVRSLVDLLLPLQVEENSLLQRRKHRRTSCYGRQIASIPVKAGDPINDIDPLATCLASALRRTPGKSAFTGFGIETQDLRRRLRVQPVRKTILFLIDASGSMLIEEQMIFAKGAVLGLLTQAYQKRYRVGVIVFSHDNAQVSLPPTTSTARARHALQAVATGGGTPLAHGLHTVLQVVRSERIRHPIDLQQLILVTDGDATDSMNPTADTRQEVLALAREFPARHIPSIVLATTDPGNLLREIAANLSAPLHKLSDVINGKVG